MRYDRFRRALGAIAAGVILAGSGLIANIASGEISNPVVVEPSSEPTPPPYYYVAEPDSVPITLTWKWTKEEEDDSIPAFKISVDGSLSLENEGNVTPTKATISDNEETEPTIGEIELDKGVDTFDFSDHGQGGDDNSFDKDSGTVTLDVTVKAGVTGTITITELKANVDDGYVPVGTTLPFEVDLTAPDSEGVLKDAGLEYDDGTITLSGVTGDDLEFYVALNDDSEDPLGLAKFNTGGAITIDVAVKTLCDAMDGRKLAIYAAQKGTVGSTTVGWMLSSAELITVTNITCPGDGTSPYTPVTPWEPSKPAEEPADKPSDDPVTAAIEKAQAKWAAAPAAVGEQTPEGFLQRLYLGIFQRAADHTGISYWVSVQKSGASQQQIITSFLHSVEGRRALGNLDNHRLVSFLYNNVLARQADQAGLIYWTTMLERQRISPQSLIAFFVNSAELNNLLSSGK
ncbi:MAG: DUF4214 domain-containing protein [Acidimicrobiia bacterium]